MQRQFDAVIRDVFRDSGTQQEERGTVLLAVSGGIDSMCMADLALHSSAGVAFAVAHCNFHLRAAESDSDAAFVEDWCRENGMRIHIADFDTAGFASSNGLSIEMAARELRYRWFGQLCAEYGYAGVSVAHNANDNAETLLLNLLRGTGLRGLAGMGTVSAIPYACSSASGQGAGIPAIGGPLLCRPLLGFTRKRIEGYMRRRGLSFREDSTNVDTAYRRNRIRNDLFERINPSFIRTFNREMEYFSQADGLLQELLQSSALPGLPHPCRSDGSDVSCDGTGDEGEARIDLHSLLSFRHWPYLLYMHLEQYGFNSAAIASVESLLRSAADGRGTLAGKFFRSGTHLLVTASDALVIRPLDLGADVKSHQYHTLAENGTVEVTGPGRYVSGGVSFTVEVKPRRDIPSLKCPAGTLMCDSSRLPFPFVCRRWQAGDWFRPFGMKGRKKVSDFFTDLKLDAFRKSSTPVAVWGDGRGSHIAAILGARIDDSLKVAPDTEEVLVLTLV